MHVAKVVIFGGTGYTGTNVAKELASRGHDVTAVARDASGAIADGVHVESGSVHDPDVVRSVVPGADVVLVAIPFREMDGTVLGSAIPALLEASAEASARFGIVGGAGSLLVAEGGPRLADTPDFPDAFRGEALAAAEVLDQLKASESTADWFYLSPAAGYGSYAPGERTGSYRVGGDLLLTDDSGNSLISGEDFAIAIADEIEKPKHHRTRFTVAY